MSLTPTEKLAGRAFRAKAQSDLLASIASDPPTHQPPNFVRIFRHICGKSNNSKAIDLKEVYVKSPAYLVTPDGKATELSTIEMTADSMIGEIVPAGRFGFIYKEGHCRPCGQTARSRAGKIVDALERPPIEGRVAR